MSAYKFRGSCNGGYNLTEKDDYWEEARAAMKLDTWSAHKDDSQSIACHPTLWHVNAGYIKAPESCFRSELLEAD